jgi:SAM-dependent MidA family methyltransferase
MRAALYDPTEGYYTAGGNHVGPEGDFYTAPATHPVFGALLALQLGRFWELLGCPGTFIVVEGGGGKGLLARDILSYAVHLDPHFHEALAYWIMEPGRRGRARWDGEGQTLSIGWEESSALPSMLPAGAFLSNELFDAYPRHRVIKQGGRLYEVFVDVAGDNFIETTAPPSTPEIEARFQRLGVELPEGCKAEIDLEGPRFLAQAGQALQRGFVLTIDYGYPAEMLYSAQRRQGTLLCYHRHTSSTNPYIRIGRQDITAHVDFTALARAGEEAGLHVEGLLTQQRYLKKLGVQAFIDRLRETTDMPQQEQMANRMAMLELTRLNGFGAFGVLLQSKGDGAPWGVDELVVSGARDGLGALPLPLLTPEHTPLLAARYPQYQALDLWPRG